MTLILVVEDDDKISANVVLRLREAGYGAQPLRSAEEAERWLHDKEVDLMLLDVRLPGMSGVELLRRLGTSMPPTIVVSGEASMGETLEAIKSGVYDFVDKPFSRERLLKSVENALQHFAMRRQIDDLRSAGQQILGASEPVEALREAIARVAPTDARILIRGESGTGKELVAASIHRQSRRRSGPFVKLNCAAIPAHLIEDELFGHARGAFTDAKAMKRGLFEEADGGTLFLDEIGDMDLALQSRLLRVLEDGRVRRIGETADRGVDVRVLAASNRDLETLARGGQFREDLYFRLATVPIDVPPLRDRAADIPLLLTAFLERFCERNGRPLLTVASDASAALIAYRWPGNVRELRNLAERLSVFATDPVTADQLPSAPLVQTAGETGFVRFPETMAVVPLREFKEEAQREYIEMVLRRTNWNVSRAAQLLQVQRTYLHQKIAALGIVRPAAAPADA